MDLSHRPKVLYAASHDQMRIALALVAVRHPGNYALSMYLGGLAVECILQAIAIDRGAAHDARHDLRAWLAKCPTELNSRLRGSAEWDEVVAVWSNELRYFSFDALLGYLRKKARVTGRKGGVESLVRSVALSFVSACKSLHERSVTEWLRNSRRR